MIKVTVVTPVHNRPAYLKEAIKSIQEQTFTDWEHIIVDDGSDNPETQAMISRIANYPKTTVYRIENKGLGGARNYAIEKAAGKYILTLDDDDKWEPSFMARAVKILETSPSVGVVTSWLKQFGNGNALLKPLGGGLKNFLISNNSVHGMYRKECWEKAGRYDENKFFQAYTDWDVWQRITSLGYTVEVIEEPLFHYRIHKNPSMLQEAESKHLELFRYMIEKNKHIYADNITDSIILLEKKLIDTRKQAAGRDMVYKAKRIIKKIFRK
jgi:glycosyltransferase involved in cell wall biosynthesis